MHRSSDGTSSIIVAREHPSSTTGCRSLPAREAAAFRLESPPPDVGTGLPDPKPRLLSAHLKLNLPPAVGIDVPHPEFERAKLGNDGLDPHRHDLTGRHIR